MNKKPTKVSADKTYLKHFSVPGFSQAQIMARAGKLPPESENFIAIVEGVYERVKSTKDGDWTEIEIILHSQIAMLNTLAANFMNKAIGGYDVQ